MRDFFVSLCLMVFLPSFLKVQCLNFLDFRNPCGKVMKRSGLKFKNFAHKGCKIAVAKFYGVFFICAHHFNVFLPPQPEVQCPNYLGFRVLGEKYWKEVVSDLKTFAHKRCKIAAQKTLVFWQILPYLQDFFVSVLLSAAVKRFFVSRMRDF